jgi:hypothetical protein
MILLPLRESDPQNRPKLPSFGHQLDAGLFGHGGSRRGCELWQRVPVESGVVLVQDEVPEGYGDALPGERLRRRGGGVTVLKADGRVVMRKV